MRVCIVNMYSQPVCGPCCRRWQALQARVHVLCDVSDAQACNTVKCDPCDKESDRQTPTWLN